MDRVKRMPVISPQNRKSPSYVVCGMLLLLLVLYLWSLSVQAAQVALIVGYDGESWYPYTSDLSKKNLTSDGWKKLSHIQNPVVITRQSKTGNYFVKTDRGDVVIYEESPDEETRIIYQNQAAGNNFTHLRAHDNGLLMVELKDGKSRETQIVNIDNKALTDNQQNTLKTHVINNQLSSQFHPLLTVGNTLFYAHVSCRVNCDPVIQEVWKKSMVTGRAEQLTLLNATTYMHSVDHDLKFGYLSSNQSGYYHLGRINLQTGALNWLTSGQSTYSYPSITEDNELYAIQRTFSGVRLVNLSDLDKEKPDDAAFKVIELPVQIKKIRYLEISNL